MLPRQFRIVKEKDFQLILRRGRGFRRPGGQLKVMPNGLAFSRFGVVISNKVAKKAFQRNLLKRRIREIFWRLRPKIKLGFDCVFVAYPPIINSDFDQLCESLTESFYKLYLLQSNVQPSRHLTN